MGSVDGWGPVWEFSVWALFSLGVGRLLMSLWLPAGAVFFCYCGAASIRRRWTVFVGQMSGISESRHSEVAALAALCFLSGPQKVLTFRSLLLCRLDAPSGLSHELFSQRDAPLGATGTIPWRRPASADLPAQACPPGK